MYSPEILLSLKEALRNAYWYKDDLRRFLIACDVPNRIVSKQGWHDPQEYKVRIIGSVLDELMALEDEGVGPFRRIIKGLLDMPNFDHLRQLDDGAVKVSNARKSVEALRQLVREHDSSFRETHAKRDAQSIHIAEAVKRRNDELERLQREFNELITLADPQKRGLLFERFLYGLFVAYDLNPRGAFRIVGEQIDGAFEFEATQYLLEAKWESSPIGAAPLDSFSKKVGRRLDNTLGLFISLNGFSDEGLAAIRGTRPSFVLMDGHDIAIVLQGLIDFRELLKRKIRYASQTGDPFLHSP